MLSIFIHFHKDTFNKQKSQDPKILTISKLKLYNDGYSGL